MRRSIDSIKSIGISIAVPAAAQERISTDLVTLDRDPRSHRGTCLIRITLIDEIQTSYVASFSLFLSLFISLSLSRFLSLVMHVVHTRARLLHTGNGE